MCSLLNWLLVALAIMIAVVPLATPALSGQTNSSIVMFHNGLLYGTTTYLGASNVGSVFTLVP